MFQCPSCARPQPPALLCSHCGAPLGVELDLFAALTLPHQLQIDPCTLETAYHELGWRIHPDRFATASPALRDASLRSTALLTRAFRTLRDPTSRGRYWLALNGQKLGENNQQVPPELAELVFEVQEQLSELRSAQGGAGRIAERRAREIELTSKRAHLQGLMAELEAELTANYASFDRPGRQAGQELFAELKRVLAKIAYLNTLLRDVDQALDSATQA